MQTDGKTYIFYANRFLCILQKKSRNKLCLRPHDTYCLFRIFFSQVNNKKIFVLVGDPLKNIMQVNKICYYNWLLIFTCMLYLTCSVCFYMWAQSAYPWVRSLFTWECFLYMQVRCVYLQAPRSKKWEENTEETNAITLVHVTSHVTISPKIHCEQTQM